MINILYLHAGAEMYGADKVLLDLVKNIDKKEYKPIVILPCEGILVEELRNLGIHTEVLPYPILRRKYFNIKGILGYVRDYFKYARILLEKSRKYKVDIVHTNTAAVLEGIYLSKKMSIPQLWHIHEIIVKPRLIFKFTSFLIARTSKAVITVSTAVKNHLEDSNYFKNKNNIHVIYNGVDSEYFNPENECEYLYNEFNIPSNAKIVGMIGRVNSWKGQYDFLEALNIVMSKNEDVYAVIVGSSFEGEEWRMDELRKKISESPCKNRIIQKDYRSDNKNLFTMFDVLVLPSTNPDPLPTVVLEGMASGCPIVGYGHGGICEMVEENGNGLLAEVRNTADLAEKILMIINNDDMRSTMGEKSRYRQVEKFSIKSYIGNFENTYKEILRR